MHMRIHHVYTCSNKCIRVHTHVYVYRTHSNAPFGERPEPQLLLSWGARRPSHSLTNMLIYRDRDIDIDIDIDTAYIFIYI